jgi:tripartite-type tricarboxylate transporter receptor subunit TctC
MKPARLLAAAALAAAQAVSSPAAAQEWPSKPVHMIVPFPAGTAPDLVARLLGERLGAIWRTQVPVENRPGAAGIPGMRALVQSPADGYTLGLAPATVLTLAPVLLKQPPFDVERDIAPVALVATTPFMIAAHPASGIASLAQLLEAAKSQPGKVSVAVVAVYSASHLLVELLNTTAGVRLVAVPYNGTPNALAAAVSGQTQAVVDAYGQLAAPALAGRLRALAVTSERRLPDHPELPTAAETLPGFALTGWVALVAPADTPAGIVEKANRDTRSALSDAQLAARLAQIGFYPGPGAPDALGSLIKSERARWAKIARDAGVQPQ